MRYTLDPVTRSPLFRGLPPDEQAFLLKRLAQGYHIIEVDQDAMERRGGPPLRRPVAR